jgi:heme exporter protein D
VCVERKKKTHTHLFFFASKTNECCKFLQTSKDIFAKKLFFLSLFSDGKKSFVPLLFFIFFVNRPTFKTITPTSRTQLKTLLQREQLLQEAERKEAERKRLEQEQEQHKIKPESHKVPLEVDVPPQVLQVRRKQNYYPTYNTSSVSSSTYSLFLSLSPSCSPR